MGGLKVKVDPNCPCTKDCPDRNYEYCKTCEKGIAYKNKQFEKYNTSRPEKEFKNYRYEVGFKYARKRAKYLKATKRR